MKILAKPAGGKLFPGAKALVLVLVCAGLCAAGLSGVFSRNIMRYLLQIFLYIALGETWNLLSGFGGMTSLGQQLYVGLAGYSVAVATSLLQMPFFLGILLGVLVSMIVAAALSPVLFRMKGMYFAIATWIAAEAAQKIFLDWKYVGQGAGLTIRIIPYPDIFRLYVMSLALCMGVLLLLSALLRSKMGLGLMAMRDNPASASTIGINLFRMRFLVYEIATALTALTGAVFFINKGVIYPESGFSIAWTVSTVFICVIGGTGTIAGPVIGAVIYVLLQEFLAHYPGWSNIMLGLITILVIRFMPGGIARQLAKLVKIIKELIKNKPRHRRLSE